MKNLFIKEDNSGVWVAFAVVAAIAVGTIAYWFYKQRDQLTDTTPEEGAAHAMDYLKAKSGIKKKHKSDVKDLEELVHSHA